MTTVDLSKLLQKWTEAKNKIAELEKNIEKYKRVANSVMEEQGNNTISNDYFTLRRKEMSRTTISKKDVPIEIWNKYSKPCKYKAYYLTEKKSKK
jgi:hypothetical protein